ncbi:oxidoreductase [Streptacidiphilus griseoplanus]|uniref:oxidoreductase n=1 Tax=Peterkaempfera griseoplana TaxID=66896 RepID=UPI0006E3DC10|nr:oxidoreductase [Peterkaempfera griseoplana]
MTQPHPEQPWSAADIGDQQGRTAVVTGANTGVGFEVAKALAEHGATVVLACRDTGKAADAVSRIRAGARSAQVTALPLDLASLTSVREAASQLRAAHHRVDLLINNAGVMWAPRGRTADGFETHLGVNHLGHFAFTGLLLDLLTGTLGSRIVTVTSPAHKEGRIDLDDLPSNSRYRPNRAYARSKLANLMFAYELNRRLAAAGAATISLAAHPGAARTELNRTMPAPFRGRSWGVWRPFTHSAEKGALPILRAAVDAWADGGQYYAPDGMGEFKGRAARTESSHGSHDTRVQRLLWEASERLTGVTYQFTTADA